MLRMCQEILSRVVADGLSNWASIGQRKEELEVGQFMKVSVALFIWNVPIGRRRFFISGLEEECENTRVEVSC